MFNLLLALLGLAFFFLASLIEARCSHCRKRRLRVFVHKLCSTLVFQSSHLNGEILVHVPVHVRVLDSHQSHGLHANNHTVRQEAVNSPWEEWLHLSRTPNTGYARVRTEIEQLGDSWPPQQPASGTSSQSHASSSKTDTSAI